METSIVVLDGVYELPDVSDPVRVIVFDRNVVMYDTWWSHKNAWSMACLTGRYSYYRLPTGYFERHSRYLRTDALTQLEIDIHRPDLPFAIAQHEDLSWHEEWGRDGAVGGLSQTGPVILTPAVYLASFGPKDGQNPAVLIKARDGAGFSETELLLYVYDIQRLHLGGERLTKGVGIYRFGIRGTLPSYYLWGSRSRLDGARDAA